MQTLLPSPFVRLPWEGDQMRSGGLDSKEQQAYDNYYERQKFMPLTARTVAHTGPYGSQGPANQLQERQLIPPDQIARAVLQSKRDELRRHITNQEAQIAAAEAHVAALKSTMHEMQRSHAELVIAIDILSNHESNSHESTTAPPPNPTVVMAKGKL